MRQTLTYEREPREQSRNTSKTVLDVDFIYRPGRPAPRIDPKRYDATLCDDGEPQEVDILNVWVYYKKNTSKCRKLSPRCVKSMEREFVDFVLEEMAYV